MQSAALCRLKSLLLHLFYHMLLPSHWCSSSLQVGRLWTSLADYYIRRGLIEKARDVYEEGLTTVTTVRDFSLIFDTLTQVLQQHMSGVMLKISLSGGSPPALHAPDASWPRQRRNH